MIIKPLSSMMNFKNDSTGSWQTVVDGAMITKEYVNWFGEKSLIFMYSKFIPLATVWWDLYVSIYLTFIWITCVISGWLKNTECSTFFKLFGCVVYNI